MAQRYVIRADVGSQGMKTILLNALGSVVASAYATYDPHYPAPTEPRRILLSGNKR
jgi:sugar (pentulose or hexulose) kinase